MAIMSATVFVSGLLGSLLLMSIVSLLLFIHIALRIDAVMNEEG